MKKNSVRKNSVRVFTAVLIISAALPAAVYAKYIKGMRLDNGFERSSYNTVSVIDSVSTDSDGRFYKSGLCVSVGETDYPVYVRVRLDVTWQDSAGNIYGQQPILGTDYTLEYDKDNWTLGSDGCYLYNTPTAGGTTVPFMTSGQSLKQIGTAPSGYVMHVEVLAETVQAIGNTDSGTAAVTDAWGQDACSSDESGGDGL